MLIAEDINAFSRQFPERPAESQNTKATQFFTRSARHSGIQNQSQFGDFHHFSSPSSRRRPAENRHSYQCNGWEIRPLAYPEITAPANFKPKRIRRFHHFSSLSSPRRRFHTQRRPPDLYSEFW